MPSIVTLTTDFGLRDEYVGVMKGVILGQAPTVSIVDLTHELDSRTLAAAAYLLAAAYRYFPAGTVHVAVVDPGVGTARRIVALTVDGHLFVGPDNGIFTLLIAAEKFQAAHEVTDTTIFRQPVSRTFHGRDIMAPVAARLAAGMRLEEVGPAIERESLVRLPLPEAVVMVEEGLIRGEVVSVDRFGNLTTNIKAEAIYALTGSSQPPIQDLLITINGQNCQGLQGSYATVPAGAIVALIAATAQGRSQPSQRREPCD
jgi:S-adenosylmethionine hydrolase